MSLRDDALDYLRSVFGRERREREKAESPSAEAEKHLPTSMFSVWGREDIGGLLSVSQGLMDRFADYEQMDEYPDINCLAGDTKVYVIEGAICRAVTIHELASEGGGYKVLAFDREKAKLTIVDGENPRLTSNEGEVGPIKFSNGETIECTKDHQYLHRDRGWVEAHALKKGDPVVSTSPGFTLKGMSAILHHKSAYVIVEEEWHQTRTTRVYDMTTKVHNFVANGIVVHNSANHYFTNDATQPDIDTGRTVWVHSSDEAIKNIADTLLRKKLKIEDEIWSMAYTLVKYGNCAAAGTRVWAGDRVTEIQNVAVGQTAIIHKDGKSTIKRVEQTYKNGTKPIFKLKTRHREAELTANHPVLVELPSGERVWRKVEELAVVRHPSGGINYTRTPKLVACTRMPAGSEKTWKDVLGRTAQEAMALDRGDCGTPHEVEVSETIEPWFCRLLGFLIGDGYWAGNQNRLCLALSRTNHESNARYVGLVERLGLSENERGLERNWNPTAKAYTDGTWTATAIFTSARLRKFFDAIGWVDGAENKRVPSWVYGLPEEHREEFLAGFMDADGWESEPETWKETAYHFEIANKDLARDLKALIDGLGYTSGNLRERTRKPGFKIKDKTVKTTKPAYTLTFSRERLPGPFFAETLVSIEPAGEAEVFDIGIGDDAHNFVADGLVIHNSYEECLVTENGLVGTNFLPVPTMRRVEQSNGALIGYVQDVTGKFTQDAADLRGMLAGQQKIPDHVALFEDWQVLHMRLRGTARRCPYGYAVSDGARWIWKRLVLLEDAMLIYKLTRAPSRYAFYIDVTDIPSDKVESFLRKAKQDLKKQKMVNPRTQRLDMRFNPMCLAGDTKVPLLDGTTKTIVDMVAAHERGEQQWVYSVDPNDGNRLKPGKVVWAGQTRKNAQLVKITLDNGESIRVTPDHKMIRRSGEFVEAQALKPGDSLMPFRSKLGDVSPSARGYEMVYDPAAKAFVFTHRMVSKALGIATGAKDSVIHHRNFNRLNNDPTNLEEMGWAAHKALHHEASGAAIEKLVAYNKSPEKRAKTAQLNHELDKPALMREAITPEVREKQKAVARAHKQEMWADLARRASASQAMKLTFSDEFVNAIRELVSEEPDAGAPRIAALANERGLVELLKKDNPTKATKIKSIHRDMLRWMSQRLGFKIFADFKSLAPCDNHKVAAIEWLTEREDTYDITIDQHHTFAVSAGVFVHNSNDEDFFIAVRENRELARVEILQGPDYQATEDVEYFAKKLHGVLKVPRSYLGQEDAVPGKSILSNEDVRAARVTMGIQRELRNGIHRLIQIDLAARGIDPFKTDVQVLMTVPSGIYELAAIEVKNARADYASRIMPLGFSKRYIQQHIFKLSEDEADLMEKQVQREAQMAPQPDAGGKGGAGGAGGDVKLDSSGALGGPIGPPPQIDAGPPPGEMGRPNNAAEWKKFDQGRRIEEDRDKKTRQNLQEIQDKLGLLLANDRAFAAKFARQQAFFQEFRQAAFARSSNGTTHAAPIGRGNGYRNGRIQ